MDNIDAFCNNLQENIDWKNLDYNQIRFAIAKWKQFEETHAKLLN